MNKSEDMESLFISVIVFSLCEADSRFVNRPVSASDNQYIIVALVYNLGYIAKLFIVSGGKKLHSRWNMSKVKNRPYNILPLIFEIDVSRRNKNLIPFLHPVAPCSVNLQRIGRYAAGMQYPATLRLRTTVR
jgi:hypothetical protein